MNKPNDIPAAAVDTPISDKLRDSGYWNPEWDSFTTLDPVWTEKFLDMAMHPMTKGLIEPKVWEFISIAVDASCTHMYGPGTRRHIRKALALGATKEEIAAFLALEFPQTKCIVEAVGNSGSTLSHDIGIDELRPGGTVSGPVLMSIADVALYVAILGKIGIVPLTVTTSLTINFLRKPAAEARIIAKCTLLKVGRTLIVGEVSLYSEGSSDLVAHVVGTYSIPPKHD